MKAMNLMLLAILGGILAACEFSVPLVETPDIPIDERVLGVWARSNDEGKEERLLVLPLGKHEYLVSYPATTTDAMFARACLTRAAGKTLVQLNWFGDAKGSVPDDKRTYQYVEYSVDGRKLTVRLLNSDVVSKDAASTNALVEAIEAGKDHPKLFREAMLFNRIAPNP